MGVVRKIQIARGYENLQWLFDQKLAEACKPRLRWPMWEDENGLRLVHGNFLEHSPGEAEGREKIW